MDRCSLLSTRKSKWQTQYIQVKKTISPPPPPLKYEHYSKRGTQYNKTADTDTFRRVSYFLVYVDALWRMLAINGWRCWTWHVLVWVWPTKTNYRKCLTLDCQAVWASGADVTGWGSLRNRILHLSTAQQGRLGTLDSKGCARYRHSQMRCNDSTVGVVYSERIIWLFLFFKYNRCFLRAYQLSCSELDYST